MRDFARAHGKLYRDCEQCGLIHLDTRHRLGPAAEKAHYGTHQNDPADPRYRAFLNRVVEPLVDRLPPKAEGLDYGSGPGPALSLLLEERGFRMSIYDPFFAPAAAVLLRSYDFITCSETAEHFFRPGEEFDRFDRLLRPGARLAVMTEPPPESSFDQWWYTRDPTHVCFYRRRTMEWIALRFGWALERPSPSVTLFQKHRQGGVAPG